MVKTITDSVHISRTLNLQSYYSRDNIINKVSTDNGHHGALGQRRLS